ncbi:MAG: hypothetical protein ACK4WB_02195, partial [Desulfatiglandales bacterium]
GLGQLMFSKFIFVFDREVDVQDLAQVLFYIGANVDPQRDVIITKGPLDVLDHASDIEGYGGKMGIDATKKWPGEAKRCPWPEELRPNPEVLKKVEPLLKYLIVGPSSHGSCQGP